MPKIDVLAAIAAIEARYATANRECDPLDCQHCRPAFEAIPALCDALRTAVRRLEEIEDGSELSTLTAIGQRLKGIVKET